MTDPYLSVQFSQNSDFDDSERDEFRVHSYPGILTLGILLLEIELGRSIESLRPNDSPNNSENVYHVDADYPIAHAMLDECRGESPDDFVKAVEACLDDMTFADKFGQNCSFDDSIFRQSIFEHIVEPLEAALRTIYPTYDEALDEAPSTSGSTFRPVSGLPFNPPRNIPPTVNLGFMDIHESQTAQIGEDSESLAGDTSEEISITEGSLTDKLASPQLPGPSSSIRRIPPGSSEKVSIYKSDFSTSANIKKRPTHGTETYCFTSVSKI